MEHVKKSIYQCAAEWGLPFGIYLACAGVAVIYADLFPPLSFIVMILTLGAPLLGYYFQRRKFIEDNGFTDYSSLWMLGILLFILGTVVASFIIFLVLQYLRPTFIYDQAQAFIKFYHAAPHAVDSDVVKVLQRAIDEKMLPTPIEMVFNMFWFVTCGGSFSSAITALIAGRPLKRRSDRQH